MTLIPYDPSKLDALSIRVLDIAVTLRHMAQRAAEHKPANLALHDKKAGEWLGHLETWARKADYDLDMAIIQTKGAQKAKQVGGRKGRGK